MFSLCQQLPKLISILDIKTLSHVRHKLAQHEIYRMAAQAPLSVGNRESSYNSSGIKYHGQKRMMLTRTQGGGSNKKRKLKEKKALNGSAEEVLIRDVEMLLKSSEEYMSVKEQTAKTTLPATFTEVEIEVQELSSTGEGLGFSARRDHVFVVPFTLPSDIVVAKVIHHFEKHSLTDIVRIVTPSPQRDDGLVFCKYFNVCSGCQFQMMPYDLQLEHKRRVIEKAFKNFSGLPQDRVPKIGPTFPSPLKKGYRTKLTPHFDGPRQGFKLGDKTPDIGFQVKGRRFVLDIEDCPIGTDAVRTGLKNSRKYVNDNLATYKRGATLLLRESTTRIAIERDAHLNENDQSIVTNSRGRFLEQKSCVTNGNEMSTEFIDETRFDSTAGSFFQNNNSILKDFTEFVRANLDLPMPGENAANSSRYLVDAYCGSGLFAISCGTSFEASVGVDISPASIDSAIANATLNNITNAKFITGDAETIFSEISFSPGQTSVIIDPPRKGCDEAFLRQLVDLGPRRIVYISCNVHTQARDLGWILRHPKGSMYNIDSIRGFDFFPQTHHVEGCAVLTKLSE